MDDVYLDKATRWIIRDKYQGNNDDPALGSDIARLKAGEPVDYVIGWKSFLDCRIDLSYKPLIPRAETEYWVEEAIGELKQTGQLSRKRALDVFAGSGCIGIALLKHLPKLHADFADVSDDALLQIKKNLDLNDIDSSRYVIVKADVLDSIQTRYDYIFANPPYIAESAQADIQKSVIDFEPHQALFGGVDGLIFIQKFLHDIRRVTNPGCTVWLEFGADQKESIEELLIKNGFGSYDFSRDQFDRWRSVRIAL